MILLKFKTEIKGDSIVDGHEGWITLDSMQFGVGRAVTMSGGGADRETSNPSLSELTFSKSTDIASGDLFLQACCGKSLGEAEIHLVQTGGTDAKVQPYLTIKLTDALVSSYSISSGGERPTESFALNFTKITYQYDAFSGDKVTTGTQKGWDMMANKSF